MKKKRKKKNKVKVEIIEEAPLSRWKIDDEDWQESESLRYAVRWKDSRIVWYIDEDPKIQHLITNWKKKYE